MTNKLDNMVCLIILSLVCGSGFISQADAEEKISFVQTATSGTTISGYVDASVEWPVGGTDSRFHRHEQNYPKGHNRGGHAPYSSAWNGDEGSVDNSVGSIIGSTEGVTIFPGVDAEVNDTGGSDGIPVFDPANINLIYGGQFEGMGVMITSGWLSSFPSDDPTITPSEVTDPIGTFDIQTVPEPSPLALGSLVCASFASSSMRKRGFRLCRSVH